jgi:cell division septal protein FtsQ
MSEKKKIAWSLWIPVILAFVLVITAWTVLIKLARENPVETIEVKGTSKVED